MSNGSLLGAIEVQMLMDLARWQQDVSNAGRVMDQGVASMKKNITGALGGLMAGLSVAAFGAWIRGAIDAADETDDLAKRMGVAAKDVAGLQLAFKFAGVEGAAMQTAMVKLAQNVSNSNPAFERMGVTVRDVDGKFRSSKDILYDVTDVFARMPEGINRTALATEVFGKAGADLMPMLVGGSEGMRQLADMAEKLGMVIDQDTATAAGDFNDTLDLLGMAGQGVARQVAASLLPTLKSLAGSLLDNVISGDKLQKAAAILAAGLKVLFTVGAVGVEIFNTAGKTIAGVAGALVAVASGEFKQAKSILEESGRDIAKGWGETAKTIEDVWSGAGASTANTALAMTGALGGTTVATKAQADAAKKAAEEQAKLTKAGQDYLEGINAQYGQLQLQLSLNRDLTDSEKELLKLDQQLAQGKLILTEAERQGVEMKLREIDAAKEQKRIGDEYQKTLVAVALHASKWNDEQARVTDGMRASNVQLIEQNDRLRLGEEAWLARERTVLLNQAADLEWQAANEGGNWQLEEQARLLRERAALLADGTALKEAKAVADEWQKTTETIQTGLSDALMRGFEDGKGFVENFKDVVLNTFKTLILKPMTNAMAAQMSGGLQSAMGWLGGTTSAGGTGGGASGSGAAAGGAAALGWVGWILAGIQQSKNDYDKGWNRGGLDQGWNQNINWAINPIYATMIKPLEKLGLISSKWADILGGDTAMARMFGRKPAEATSQGVAGSFGGGSFVGNQFVDWRAEGGWFRSDKTGTNLSAVDAALGAALGSGSKALFEQTKAYASALALPINALAGVTSTARIELGDDADKNLQAIQAAVADYGTALARNYEAVLKDAAEPGEAAADTLVRLGQAIGTVNDTFQALGLHLVQTSVAGGAAASELVSLTGGLDAFLAKSQTYLAAYFTQSEQLGLGAGNVLRTLQSAGIDFGGANERSDLRTLMESLDPNSAGGREQMAALLSVAGDFAQLTDYLAENSLTLAQLAQQAPTVGVALGTDPATRSATAAETSAALLQASTDRLDTVASNTAGTVDALQALLNLQAAANQALLDRLASVQQSIEDAARLADLAPTPWESTGG